MNIPSKLNDVFISLYPKCDFLSYEVNNGERGHNISLSFRFFGSHMKHAVNFTISYDFTTIYEKNVVLYNDNGTFKVIKHLT